MDKFQKNNLLISFLKNRLMLVLSLIVLVMAIVFVVYDIINADASDAFIWSRYTSFGPTRFYRDKWFSFYSWPVFGLVVLGAHMTLAIKLFKQSSVKLAVAVLSMAIAIFFVGILVVSRILALPR